MITQLKNQAIKTALAGDWQQAILCNESLLQNDPTDIDTMNRLGFAYAEIGDIKKAKDTYQKVLNLDAFNPIAQKNLKRLASIGNVQKNNIKQTPSAISMSAFLEETGKTKCVELVNIAQADIIAQLRIGESAIMAIKRLKAFILNHENKYIGMLPDSIGARLIKLIEGGNVYEVFIKSFNNHKVTIFIKETKRAEKFKNQPSFLSTEKNYLTFSTSKNSSKNGRKSVAKKNHLEEEDFEETE